MNTHRPVDFKVSEEAALWLHRLSQEDTPEVRAQFSAWIKQAAVNLEEFLFAQAIWKELDGVDAAMAPKLAETPRSSIVAFPAQEVPNPPPAGQTRRWRRTIGLAAAVLIVMAAGLIFYAFPFGGNVYSTAIGDQQTVKLDDGSVIHLNTGSRVEIRYSQEARAVRLIAGEALFTVERDAVRPFYVLADDAKIQALGTQFNVYRTPDAALRVTVVEGAVRVSRSEADSAVRLDAGDEAQVGKNRIVKVAASDVARAVAWRARRLVFPGSRIAEVADEFNRYNKTPIHVEGEALRERRLSGVFDADDPYPFLEHLSRDPAVAIERTATEIRVRLRTE